LSKAPLKEKILMLDRAKALFSNLKSQGKKIVHCHGVFDLFYPGHLLHFQQAKKLGDILVVSLTPDRFVNKGPSRPYFTEDIRLLFISSLEIVDYVVLNKTQDAIYAIENIAPDFYVKGEEYKDHSKDVTKKIQEETATVKNLNGKVFYTSGKTFSSSTLLNSFFSNHTPSQKALIHEIKKKYSTSDILQKIDSLSSIKVQIIADAFTQIDHYVKPRLSTRQEYVSLYENRSSQGAYFIERCLSPFADTLPFPSTENLPIKNRFLSEEEKICFFRTDHNLHQNPLLSTLQDAQADLVIGYDFQMGYFDSISLEHLSSYAFVTESPKKQNDLCCKAGLPNKEIQFVFKYVKQSIYPVIEEDKHGEKFTKKGSIVLPAFEKSLQKKSFFPFFALLLQGGNSVELSGFLSVTYSSMGLPSSKQAFVKYLVHLLK